MANDETKQSAPDGIANPMMIMELRRRAFEEYPDASVIVNSAGQIIDANKETEFMFGYLREELIGQTVSILVPPELRELHERHVAGFFMHLRRRQMGAGLRLQGCRKDGARIPINIHLAPIFVPVSGDAGGIFALAVIRWIDK